MEHWKNMAINLSGPWKAMINNKTVTLIDIFTSWPKIIPIQVKTRQNICDLIKQEWLWHYLCPSCVIYDAGTEFDNQWFYTLARKWYYKLELIMIKNLHANAIIKHLHKIMSDMLHVQLVQWHEHEDLIKDLLSAATYGIHTTVYGKTGYLPAQLVFSKDMIL